MISQQSEHDEKYKHHYDYSKTREPDYPWLQTTDNLLAAFTVFDPNHLPIVTWLAMAVKSLELFWSINAGGDDPVVDEDDTNSELSLPQEWVQKQCI